MAKLGEDPENARFYRSGAETPSYDNIPANGVAVVPADDLLSVHRGASPEPVELRHSPVRVYTRNARPMQAGPAHAGEWVVAFEPYLKPGVDPLMGWISSADPQTQVRLIFPTQEAALAYCRRERLAFDIIPPETRHRRLRSYADNFTPFEDGGAKPIYPH